MISLVNHCLQKHDAAEIVKQKAPCCWNISRSQMSVVDNFKATQELYKDNLEKRSSEGTVDKKKELEGEIW